MAAIADARGLPRDRRRGLAPILFLCIIMLGGMAASIGMAAYTTGATPGPRHPVKGADSEAAWLPLASLPTKRSSWAMSSMASAAAATAGLL